MHFGLVGASLSHSFSQFFFTEKFTQLGLNHSYENLEFPNFSELKTNFPTLVSQYKGLNVTIPYKKDIAEILDEINPIAIEIGSVNCIKIKDNRSIGFNTDYLGFYESVKKKSFPRDRKVLLLGNGGAALAVRYAVESMLEMSLDIVARKNTPLLWNQLENLDLSPYSLIINTTPLGMYPYSDNYPPLNYLSAQDDTLFMDLVYNPMVTPFLLKADEQGCMILNGLPMLHIQAELSWNIWNDDTI